MNINEIINRVKEIEGLHTKKEIAGLLCISPQDFSQREKRGTLLPLVIEWAMKKNLSLDWLVSGVNREDQGFSLAESSGPGYGTDISRTESAGPEMRNKPDPGLEGLRLLTEIMGSGKEPVIQMTLEQLRAVARFMKH